MNPVQAVLDGKPQELRRLLQENSESIGARSPTGKSLLSLALDVGVAESVAVLLRAGAPGTEEFTDYAGLLGDYISEVSEEWTCAGWLNGIEFVVWSLVCGDCASYEFTEYHDPLSLSGAQRREWLFLYEKAGGWPTFERFMPSAEWEALYARGNRGS